METDFSQSDGEKGQSEAKDKMGDRGQEKRRGRKEAMDTLAQ